MAKRFVNDEAKSAFKEAIVSIEDRSSAEVMITVRHHSGSYLHADLILGGLATLATLAFTLFSKFEFTLMSILIDPVIVGGLIGLLSTQLPMMRRMLTLQGARRSRVVTAAQSAFYEKGVRMTSGRTGMLVYISLLEHAVEVVIDRGVQEAVPTKQWQAATAAVEETLTRTMDAGATAKKIAELGEICEAVMERSEDDINELPDEVCAP